MLRALLFAGSGAAWFTSWFVTPPGGSVALMQEWPRVILFSVTLLLTALALVTFGRMVGGPWVMRMATIAAGAAAVMSAVNIVEDGFRVEGAFYLFVVGLLILDVALAGLALAIARTVAGRRMFLAAIPATILAGILVSPLGGPLMLGGWLAASAVALRDGGPLP